MQMNTEIFFCFHFFMIFLPVSQIASFNFFPPTVTCFTLKSTPAKNLQEINKHQSYLYWEEEGNAKLTDGRREILKGIGSEAQDERALPHPRIPDQQQLEQVIELRRIHSI